MDEAQEEIVRAYMGRIGRVGGRSKSPKKLRALKESLKKANAARLKRRIPDGRTDK